MANDNDDKKVEDVVEETAQPEVVEEAPKEKPAPEPVVEEATPVTKSTKELTGKLAKLATEIEGLTVLELSELSSYLEEKFGVSSAPMMVAGGAPAGAGASAEPAEEKTHYNVILTDGGANKLGAIKAVRELRQDLGLMEAKKLVESTPQTVLENAKKEDAEAAVKKLVEAGSKAEMK